MVFCLENKKPRCPRRSAMVHLQASEVQQLLHNKFVVILGDSSECSSRIRLFSPAPAACFLSLEPVSPPSLTSSLTPSLFQSSRFSHFISLGTFTSVLTDVACQAFHTILLSSFFFSLAFPIISLMGAGDSADFC